MTTTSCDREMGIYDLAPFSIEFFAGGTINVASHQALLCAVVHMQAEQDVPPIPVGVVGPIEEPGGFLRGKRVTYRTCHGSQILPKNFTSMSDAIGDALRNSYLLALDIYIKIRQKSDLGAFRSTIHNYTPGVLIYSVRHYAMRIRQDEKLALQAVVHMKSGRSIALFVLNSQGKYQSLFHPEWLGEDEAVFLLRFDTSVSAGRHAGWAAQMIGAAYQVGEAAQLTREIEEASGIRIPDDIRSPGVSEQKAMQETLKVLRNRLLFKLATGL